MKGMTMTDLDSIIAHKHFRPGMTVVYGKENHPNDTFSQLYGGLITPKELADSSNGLLVWDKAATDRLYALRVQCGFPFIFNSGTRSLQTNLEAGGHPTSAHMVGRAFDIQVKSGQDAMEIVRLAPEFDFKGVGIRRPSGEGGYVHVDDVDRGADGAVIWTYSDGD